MRPLVATSASALLLLGGCGAGERIGDALGKEARACREALSRTVENARGTAADAVEKGKSPDQALSDANPPECRNIDDNLSSRLRKDLADKIRGE